MNLDKPIGEIFVEEGLVSREELLGILAERADTTEHLGDLLVRLGKITVKQKLKCLGTQMGVPFVDLTRIELEPDTARIIPHSVAIRLLAIPIEKTDVAASVAMANPLDLAAIDELASLTKLDIDPLLALDDDIRDGIFRTFGAYDDLGEIVGEAVKGVDIESLKLARPEEEEQPINVVELREVADVAPVIKLANALMTKAISMRASDIHIEPHQRRVRVRVRIDGLLQELMVVPKDLQHPLVSRIKVLANLDIAERRVPQDGRCTLISQQGEFDFRVSTYPGVFGEKVVIRILDKQSGAVELSKLGFVDHVQVRFEERLREPQGLVLVTGPTGSGKTTTLYAAINCLNDISRNIITIEDPVEYQLDGISQGNVNPLAGMTFASGLRAILRQDPDIILVGEVRDEDTAETAIEAALTGHLVLTSLHANDSVSALTRLIDMGIEPFLLCSSVTCSVAQRLVRTICPKCREAYKPPREGLNRLNLPEEVEYFRGRGCEFCAKTGFRGRTGIYELFEMDSEVRRMVLAGRQAGDIRAEAEKRGMLTLRGHARQKV
ncbi:MAG TPA: ATPase, T2SS/T4P/T4SS family, partial [Fimbriimonadaceae bacterium]|nr:ATPase, T2SS/T4P/T4SS family [Fimbriimonadaceae bacterium]